MASRFESVNIIWIHEITGIWCLKDGLAIHERIDHLEYTFVEHLRQIDASLFAADMFKK